MIILKILFKLQSDNKELIMPMTVEIHQASILIVDDQLANVQLLEQLLADAGYTQVTSTMKPEEVCALHRKNGYDLILLDLQMPVMDGFQVMEGLKTNVNDHYLPVIVLTAQPGHKLRALAAGAKDFISKPFNKKELLARVRSCLAMAKHGGIAPQLPGAVLIAAPDWRILALSPSAAILLGIASRDAMRLDLTQLLLPAERDSLAMSDEPADLRLAGHPELTARHTAVTAPDGKLLLRLVTLGKNGAG